MNSATLPIEEGGVRCAQAPEGEADADDDVPEEIDEEEPMEVCDEDIPVEGEPVDASTCIHPLADSFGNAAHLAISKPPFLRRPPN